MFKLHVISNYMKYLLFVTALIMILTSCKKKDKYYKFSSKELDFVNYAEGQMIKFIDTNLISKTLVQRAYKRGFHERWSTFTSSGEFSETYEVSYLTLTGIYTYSLGFSISLDKERKTLDIDFNGYQLFANPDSLRPSISLISINGVNYSNVYKLKVYNQSGTVAGTYGQFVLINGQQVRNTDTATLYHNQQYGVIQLLFPNGKRIIRTE